MKKAVFLLFLIFITREVMAMGFLDVGKTCVFSQVKARITKNGEPLKNIEVIRRWEWQELQSDSTRTNDNGEFEFPPIFESSVTRLLPMELVIAQGLYVIVDGEERKIWSNSKREPGENAEFQGHPISLQCEITNELRFVDDFDSSMRTLCTWELN